MNDNRENYVFDISCWMMLVAHRMAKLFCIILHSYMVFCGKTTDQKRELVQESLERTFFLSRTKNPSQPVITDKTDFAQNTGFLLCLLQNTLITVGVVPAGAVSVVRRVHASVRLGAGTSARLRGRVSADAHHQSGHRGGTAQELWEATSMCPAAAALLIRAATLRQHLRERGNTSVEMAGGLNDAHRQARIVHILIDIRYNETKPEKHFRTECCKRILSICSPNR